MNRSTPKLPTALSWRRVLRLLWLLPALLVSLLLLAALALFLRVDFVSFRPHVPAFTKMIDVQRTATPHVPGLLVRYWERGFGSDIDHFTARQLLSRHGLGSPSPQRTAFRSFMWSALLKWHFSKGDRVLLHCALLEDGEGSPGIHHLSQRLLGRPVDQLNNEELAKLAVASTHPRHWLANLDALQSRGEEVLKLMEGS